MKRLLEQEHGIRIMVFALLLTMLAWLFPIDWQTARAAEGDKEISVDGGKLLFDESKETITGYKGNITEFKLPEDLDKPVTAIKAWAFYDCASLTSVHLPASVTAIGPNAFLGCQGLTKITVDSENPSFAADGNVLFNKGKTQIIQYPTGNTDTSYTIPNNVKEIKGSAFSNSKLETVTIPDNVTAIEQYAFYSCPNLSEITLPNSAQTLGSDAFRNCGKLSTVTSLGRITSIEDWTFKDCGSLKSVNIPNSVTQIGNKAFDGCGSLESITIPDSVTQIGMNAFSSCDSLKSITIPDSVIEIGVETFLNCSALTSVTISKGMKSIPRAVFQNCSGLTEVEIPDSIQSIGSEVFYDCVNLKSVKIGSSVQDIQWGVFQNCSSLTEITLPASVSYIDPDPFAGCTGLVNISVNENNAHYVSQEGVLLAKDQITEGQMGLFRYPPGRNADSYTIPDNVTSIGYTAFHDCNGLTKVTIPGSVTEIAPEAFIGCVGLTALIVDEKNEVYASQQGILFNKDGTELLLYPTGNKAASYVIPDNVTSIGYQAFYYCDNLTKITIPDSVTEINIDAFNPEVLQEISGYSSDSAAAKYAGDQNIKYTLVGGSTGPDDGNTKPGDSGTKPGDGGTKPDSKGDDKPADIPTLPSASTKPEVGNTISDKKSNAIYMVTRTKQNSGTVTYQKPVNNKKTSAAIPSTVKIQGRTYKVTAIEKNAFKGNKQLKTVKIGSNVQTIGAGAFKQCTKLKAVTLPSKVKTIQKGAFSNCKSLKTITIKSKKLTKKTVGAGAFKGVNPKVTVKAPKGKAKAYKKLLRSRGLSKRAKVK